MTGAWNLSKRLEIAKNHNWLINIYPNDYYETFNEIWRIYGSTKSRWHLR
jgi:hypothetical protein